MSAIMLECVKITEEMKKKYLDDMCEFLIKKYNENNVCSENTSENIKE